MTIEEYVKWKEERSKDASEWSVRLCNEADALIKETALSNLENYLYSVPMLADFREWALMMAKFHFGCAETDEMLQALGCYPTWM